MPDPSSDDDPILRQRARALKLAETRQRPGYLLLLVSLLVFYRGLVFGITGDGTPHVAACLGLGGLAPPQRAGARGFAAGRRGRDVTGD